MHDLDRITGDIIGAAMRVHSKLGPGLLESAYHACVARELRKRGLSLVGYRVDMLVESTVVVELKAIGRILQVHRAQLLSHLRLGAYPVGLLINFNVLRLKQGISRVVNTR
ncbi:MAG TPA: GxxExxY protein [Gemmatimonadaceae bacterium]|nr:GxxExxY protein [Gemmatimonadaceae bacterium]